MTLTWNSCVPDILPQTFVSISSSPYLLNDKQWHRLETVVDFLSPLTLPCQTPSLSTSNKSTWTQWHCIQTCFPPAELSQNSRRTPAEIPQNSCRTPAELPQNCRRTPAELDDLPALQTREAQFPNFTTPKPLWLPKSSWLISSSDPHLPQLFQRFITVKQICIFKLILNLLLTFVIPDILAVAKIRTK